MKIRIGVLAFSDGREYVYKQLKPINQKFLKMTVDALQNTGEIEPITGKEIIWTPQLAKIQAEKLSSQNIHGTILNFSTWSFPNFALIAAQHGKGPYLMLSNLNPKYPGLVAMLASAGSLDQIGIFNERIWGDISRKEIIGEVLVFCRAAYAVSTLKGQTFGLFGGRSYGMCTATADLAQWQKIFGVDVEHIDQLEIIRLASQVLEKKVNNAFKWLTENVGEILYDNNMLTEEKLKFQIRCYEATKLIVEKKRLDFIGVKCHTELSSYYATQCFSQAFLNDPYDWGGRHEPVVCACEADMDGALTMQILKLLSHKPVLFMDFRHYDEKEDIFVFCNCGSHATWYAARSDDPEKNLKKINLCPVVPFFTGGGAHIQYVASEGEATLARLSRRNGEYSMTIAPANFVEYPREKCEETTKQWPHVFAKLKSDPNRLISEFSSNHIHAVAGSFVNELIEVCKMLKIRYTVFD